MTNDVNAQPENSGYSRRTVFKATGVAALAVGGADFLAACGSDSSSGGSGGPQKKGGTLIHGATGGSSKDTLHPHHPGNHPDIARTFNLYEPLLVWDNDYKIAPGLAESV